MHTIPHPRSYWLFLQNDWNACGVHGNCFLHVMIGTPYMYTTTDFGPRKSKKVAGVAISWCICGCPKQTGGSYVIRPTKYQTMNLHGPHGAQGAHGAQGTHGAHGAHGAPWGPSRPAAAAHGGRRRPAESATQFGALRNRHLFLNKIKQLCFGRPHMQTAPKHNHHHGGAARPRGVVI